MPEGKVHLYGHRDHSDVGVSVLVPPTGSMPSRIIREVVRATARR